MNVPTHLLEVGKSLEQNCKYVLNYEGWRIGILRLFENTRPSSFHKVGRHTKTNEIFILTDGDADMIICEKGDVPGQSYVFKMEKGVAYNVPQLVWHGVVMSKNAHIVLFEKSDTSDENTDYANLDKEVIKDCKKQFTCNIVKKKKKKKSKPTNGSKRGKKNEESTTVFQQLSLWEV